ncbi:AsnC family transcriptional regulator [Nakamurella sp. YIM 132087]|uniref:AsnC family transcriptional regulator n=1 Tax=Nakamurella alba TaxID=2665158 RepID=A0A7K1FS04_9ACTN|nr:Lrp/AsnC family transcriptional regulator [Nakamurella alba]MTD16925.1 AsnC family transcriptional regulator [Nakamurella alba]
MSEAPIDDLDRRIIRSVQIHPRAPMNLLARALEVSEQTVSRRFQRLRGEGVVRVIGLVDPRRLGQVDWTVRLTCRPHAARAVARALAARDDVAWVALTGGGAEIMASIRARTRDQRDDLLLRRLPRTAEVLSLQAMMVLHRFAGQEDDWSGFGGDLADGAVALLREHRPVVDHGAPAPEPTADDEPMLAALRRDGRTPVAALAAATGWTAGRVTRRLDHLIGTGTLYLDVDLATARLGFPLDVMHWLEIEPARVHEFGEILGQESDVSFCAATTGSANLMAASTHADLDSLYDFTGRVGRLGPGLRHLEVVPVLRRLKQAGSLLEGSGLRDPSVPV